MSPQLTVPGSVDDADHDNGYAPLTVEHYINQRVQTQTNWYKKRSSEFLRYTKRFYVLILLTGILSSILAFLGWGVWIAAVITLTQAFNAWLSLRHYELCYGIYNQVAVKLENRIGIYRRRYPVEKPVEDLTEEEKERIVNWATTIETIFTQERDLWQLTVLRGQEVSDQLISNLISGKEANSSGKDKEL